MYEERELQWDDVIEKEGSEFATLPEGDYTFMVESLNVEDSHQKKATSFQPVIWQP